MIRSSRMGRQVRFAQHRQRDDAVWRGSELVILMLTNFYAERGYKNKGKPKKALLREW